MLITVTEAGSPPLEYRTNATEVILGRSPGCDIVIDRPFVSARHLRILGGVVVHDMGSTNGTYIDGQPLERPEWLDGRIVTVGGTEVAVVIDVDGHAPRRPTETYTTAPVQVIGDSGLDLRSAEPGIGLGPSPAHAPVDPTPVPAIADASEPIPGPIPAPEPEPEPEAAPAQEPVPELEAEPVSRPMPKRSAPTSEDAGVESTLLMGLIETDCQGSEPKLDGTVTDFFTLEAFRFLRDVETIVSRMAGELANRSTNETVLPNAAGNVMRHLADIAVQPDDTYPREQLLEHLGEVRRWLIESLTAYQRASVRLVQDVRASLSPFELVKHEPMPKLHKALGLQEMVLWKRAQEKLQDLTPDVIAERLDEFAREEARVALRIGTECDTS